MTRKGKEDIRTGLFDFKLLTQTTAKKPLFRVGKVLKIAILRRRRTKRSRIDILKQRNPDEHF